MATLCLDIAINAAHLTLNADFMHKNEELCLDLLSRRASVIDH
jgi:hypothetical protein